MAVESAEASSSDVVVLNSCLYVQFVIDDLDVDGFWVDVIHLVLFVFFLSVIGRSEELFQIFQRCRGRENEFVEQGANDSTNDRTDPVNLQTTSPSFQVIYNLACISSQVESIDLVFSRRGDVLKQLPIIYHRCKNVDPKNKERLFKKNLKR